MAKRANKESRLDEVRFDKEVLFNDFLIAAVEAFQSIEMTFGVEGLGEQFIGEPFTRLTTPEVSQDPAVIERVKASEAWQGLLALYDYSVDGVLKAGEFAEEIVIGSAVTLSHVEYENHSPSSDWGRLIAMGDGRFALDEGSDLDIPKLALLANVDVRTVRNAISAGDLASQKVESLVFVDNASARRWLQGRRGFISTRIIGGPTLELEKAQTPAELGAFLAQRHEQRDLEATKTTLPPSHPAMNRQNLTDLESGVFSLPLDTVFPLADFYQLDRTAFLKAVMRCFFDEQYQALVGAR